MADPLSWIDDESADWASRGLVRTLSVLDRGLVNFASNDYLGLAADPRLLEAASAVTASFGTGASPLVSGWTEYHQRLVEDLARFEQTESAVLFSSGYAANLGAISAVVGKGDAVYLDRLNHACLIDGAKLSGATLRVYPHNDADRLEHVLKRDRGRFRRLLIATDGVFSMDGDLAPLADLVSLADDHDAILLVDEAHGTGVYGPDGRGASSVYGVANRIPIKVGTLSKAIGTLGGFVAGSNRLCDWLINRARPLIYSTSLPLPVVAAASRSLAIIQDEPWRRTRLLELSARLRTRLGIGSESYGPIVPWMVGSSEAAMDLSSRLRAEGFLVPAIRSPTVPSGTARLRITVTAAHTEGQIDKLSAILIRESR